MLRYALLRNPTKAGSRTDLSQERFWQTYLLDSADNLELGRRVEIMTLLAQQQLQVASYVTASNVGPHYAVRHCKAFIDWN